MNARIMPFEISLLTLVFTAFLLKPIDEAMLLYDVLQSL
jgi:hypothetical protein